MPTFFSPFKWRVVAHLSNAYEVHDVDLLDARLRRPAGAVRGACGGSRVRLPNVWMPPVRAAASTPLAQTFLGFSRFPAARWFVDQATGIATVRWNDMRFVAGPIDQQHDSRESIHGHGASRP